MNQADVGASLAVSMLTDPADIVAAPASARRNVRAALAAIESGDPPDIVLPKVRQYLEHADYLLRGCAP